MPRSAAVALICGLWFGSPAFAQTTPSNLQTSVNALPWTNGVGLLTGVEMQALWNQDIQVFETWAAPASSTITINDVVCSLNSSCTISSGGGSGTVTSVAITAGANVTTSGTCSGTTTINCTVNAAGAGGSVVTTVAGLTTAFPTPGEGQGAYVTDAVSCVFGAGLTGGGSGVPGCSVHYNGSAWTAG